jgi:hypothetical protein
MNRILTIITFLAIVTGCSDTNEKLKSEEPTRKFRMDTVLQRVKEIKAKNESLKPKLLHENPNRIRLENLLMEISGIESSIRLMQNEGDLEKVHYYKKRLNPELLNLDSLLMELDDQSDYDLQSDSIMLKRVTYLEIDSLTLLFSNHEYVLPELSVSNVTTSINKAFDDKIFFWLQFDKRGNLVNNGLERLTYGKYPERIGPDPFRFGYIPFSASQQDFHHFGNYTVGLVESLVNYKTSYYKLTIWEEQGEHLVLKHILDSYLTQFYGQVFLDTMVQVNDTTHIVIGRKEGGEGGDYWGGTWVRKWTEPTSFEEVYGKHWVEDGTDATGTVKYELTKDSTIVIKSKNRNDTAYVIEEIKLTEF